MHMLVPVEASPTKVYLTISFSLAYRSPPVGSTHISLLSLAPSRSISLRWLEEEGRPEMGAEYLLLGGSSGKVSAAAASSALAASSVGTVASLQRRGRRVGSALRQRGCAWQWQQSHTATGQKSQHKRCCAIPELWRGDPEDGKVGFEKEILKPGTGPKPVQGQKVTVHCTGYGKDGDLSQKFWSTKDRGQRAFTFTIGLGSVIKGWDEGVLTMQVGEVARITCTPDYGYGASGFPAWGIQPNSVLVFEIEVLSAK